MQEQEIRKASVCVSEAGDVVFVTRTNVQSTELDNYGRGWIYHTGSVLRSSTLLAGSKYAGNILRPVCHIEDLLRLAEEAGYDLNTPAQKPDSELSAVEMLQRQVAELQRQVLKQQSPQDSPHLGDVVARPRVGIPALQKK